MAVITTPDYISVSKMFNNARFLVSSSNDYLLDAVEIIVLSNDLETEIDLLMPFWTAYQGSVANTSIPGYFLSTISSLQQHVLDRAIDPVTSLRYTDINDWMRDESVTVPETFAALSEIAGWIIDHDRIESDPTVTIAY